jgi:hypothetical protein
MALAASFTALTMIDGKAPEPVRQPLPVPS